MESISGWLQTRSARLAVFFLIALRDFQKA